MDPAGRIEALEALYAELPALDCKRLCGADSCGLIRMTGLEFDRLLSARSEAATRFGRDSETVYLASPDPSDPERLVCPMLRDGLCSAHTVRPLLCRAWYCTPDVRCPHGCEPDRWLTEAEAAQFERRVQEIAQTPVQARVTPSETEAEALADAIREHVPDKLIKRVLGLVNELNELAPDSWTPAKVETVFKGKDAKAAVKEAEAMEAAISELRAQAEGAAV